MRGRSPLALAMLGAFVVGMALMIFFEATVTRILGMAALIAFMVSGLFLVASPAMLEPEEDDDELSEAPSRPRTTRTGSR